jgi:GtrA-like protein
MLLIRFGLVGIAATALYAALASVLMSREWIGLSAVRASLAAYVAAALFSYLAHKAVTFMSREPDRTEAALSAAGGDGARSGLLRAGASDGHTRPARYRPGTGHMHRHTRSQSRGAPPMGVHAADVRSIARLFVPAPAATAALSLKETSLIARS